MKNLKKLILWSDENVLLLPVFQLLQPKRLHQKMAEEQKHIHESVQKMSAARQMPRCTT